METLLANAGTLVVVGILVALPVICIAIQMVSRQKAKIDIQFENKTYRLGDTIDGKVYAKIKKNIAVREIIVELRASEHKKNYFLIRERAQLSGQRTMSAGTRWESSFSLTLPAEVHHPAEAIADMKFMGLNVGAFAKLGLQSVRGELIITFDVEGLNVVEKKEILLSLV